MIERLRNHQRTAVLTAFIALTVAACAAVKPEAPAATETAREGFTPVTVRLNHTERSFSDTFLGYNANLCRGGSWQDPKLATATRRLVPGHIRYPAGTIANYWDWERGWFLKDSEPPYGLGNVPPNPYTLQDLKKGCETTGAVPVFVLNMMTSTLDSQLGMLRAADELDLPIRYVELGNEFYLDRPHYTERFPTAESYARECNEWIKAIRDAFPDARIGVVGAAYRPWDTGRRKSWNKRMLNILEDADALTLHIYSGANLLNEEDRIMEAVGLVDESDAKWSRGKPKKGFWGYKQDQQIQRDMLETERGVTRMLGMPFKRWETVQATETLPEGMSIWVTEYNLFDRTGPVRGTWAHGLFAATFPLMFLKSEQITMATYHSLYGSPWFCAIFSPATSYEGLVGDAPELKAFGLSAAGHANRILGKAMRNGKQARPLAFDPNPTRREARTPDYPALAGWEFSSDNQRSAVIVNLSADRFVARLPEDHYKRGTGFEQLYDAPHAYVATDASLNRNTGILGNELPLPPYSITYLGAAGKTTAGTTEDSGRNGFPRLSGDKRFITLAPGTASLPVGLYTMVRSNWFTGNITADSRAVQIAGRDFLQGVALGITWEDMQPESGPPNGDVLRTCLQNIDKAAGLAGRDRPLPVLLKFYFYHLPPWTMKEGEFPSDKPVATTNKLGMRVIRTPPLRRAAGNVRPASDTPLSTDPVYHKHLKRLLRVVAETLDDVDPDATSVRAVHYAGPAMNSNQMRVPMRDLFPDKGEDKLGMGWTKEGHIRSWIGMADAMAGFPAYRRRCWVFNFTNLPNRGDGTLALTTAEQAQVYQAVCRTHPAGPDAVIAKTESLCVNFQRRLDRNLHTPAPTASSWRLQMLTRDRQIPYQFIAGQTFGHGWENWAGFSPKRDHRAPSLYPFQELMENSLYLDLEKDHPSVPQGTIWVEIWPQEAVRPDEIRRFDDKQVPLTESLQRWDQALRKAMEEALSIVDHWSPQLK